jgi:VanZ family protein
LNSERRDLVKAWIAAALWIGIIAVESTEWLSAEHTGRFLYPIFHFLMGMDFARFESLHHYLRKIGHFVGYFALSALLFRAWKNTLHVPGAKQWALRWAGIAFGMAVLVASLDEWHQTFLPSRTGRFADVVLDSSAALTAQILICIFFMLSRRSQVTGGSKPSVT